jgi:hypothetical protein
MGHPNQNVLGWQSLAAKWDDIGWPRKPKWRGEFSTAEPLLSTLRGKDTVVLGSTPEFRKWLQAAGARVFIYEINPNSYTAMSRYLQMHGIRTDNEIMIHVDWLDPDLKKTKYAAVLGDLVSGYLMTLGLFEVFTRNIYNMLQDGGFFLLREFVLLPCAYPLNKISDPHVRRWSAAMTPNIAVYGRRYYEEGLIQFLERTGDIELLATCGNPPRERLVLTYAEFESTFRACGLLLSFLFRLKHPRQNLHYGFYGNLLNQKPACLL